jgi:hypothetical protein
VRALHFFLGLPVCILAGYAFGHWAGTRIGQSIVRILENAIGL